MRRRARLHSALGDPARLAIVDALPVGDASPGEIARDFDDVVVPQAADTDTAETAHTP